MYDIQYGNTQEKKKAISRFKFWNKWIIVPLYRMNILPLFMIGRIFLLIYHIGRKSGKKYITPVEYRKRGDTHLLFASRGTRSDWYLNIKEQPDQTVLKIGFRKHQPRFVIIEEYEQKLDYMIWYCDKFPKAAKYLMGWDADIDTPDEPTIGPLADHLGIISFYLE